MEENEKKWCYKALIGTGIGFVIGVVIKHVLLLFITSNNVQAFLTLIIPATMILGLTIVHRMYQKEKDETFS